MASTLAPQATALRKMEPYTPQRSPALMTGRANVPLAQAISSLIGVPLTAATFEDFSDGEVHCTIEDTVRGKDVFFIQPICGPDVNKNFVEVLAGLDAIGRSSPREVTYVCPYYAYGRSDRKSKGREAIMAKVLADCIGVAGGNKLERIVTLDLHAPQIQGCFTVKPGDHFFATVPLTLWMAEHWLVEGSDAVIVSPDAGGMTRARAYAKRLGLPIASIDKRRTGKNTSEGDKVIGDVDGKDAIIVDDMIDTAGTIENGAKALRAYGARSVRVVATHPVCSGPAFMRLANPIIDAVAVTNSIPIPAENMLDKISIVPLEYHYAELLVDIFYGDPVSEKIGWLSSEVK